MVQVIAEGRKLPPGAVRGVIDQGPFIGKNALDSGLVDGLIFEDDMLAQLNGQLKTTLKKIGAHSYSKAAAADPSGQPRIAYVTGDGEITPVSYTHLRAHETGRNLVCRLLIEKKK